MTAMRYVVLEHHWEGVHYDFMLEAGDRLLTWKLQQLPAPGVPQIAVATFDHRLLYLDYEGPISGNRGHVVRWDHGDFTLLAGTENRQSLQVQGQRLRGVIELRRL